MATFRHSEHGVVQADRNRVNQMMTTPTGPIEVPIGHWIVSTSMAGRIAVSDSEFRAAYQPLDNSAHALLSQPENEPIHAPEPEVEPEGGENGE